MCPEVFHLESYFLMSVVAGVAGAIVLYGRLEHLSVRPHLALCCVGLAALAIALGSRALFALEEATLPLETPALLSYRARVHFRFPGGIVAYCSMLFIAASALQIPSWRMMDACVPLLGLVTFCLRVGCLMNGCCFGAPTSLPWGMRFPRGSLAYDWQMARGDIHWPQMETLAVHPVQILLALAGILIFLLSPIWAHNAKRNGAVAAKCIAGMALTTIPLEFLRDQVLWLNLVVESAMLFGVVLWWHSTVTDTTVLGCADAGANSEDRRQALVQQTPAARHSD